MAEIRMIGKVMDYREFVDKVAEDVRKLLPDYESIVAHETDKLQSSYYGVMISASEGDPVKICIDLTSAYQYFVDKGWSVYDSILSALVTSIRSADVGKPKFDEGIMIYGNALSKMMLRVVSTEKNADALVNVPHIEKEDLSIAFSIVLSDDDDKQQSVVVTNSMLEAYGVTVEQLFNDVVAVASNSKPASVRKIGEIMAEMMGLDASYFPDGDYPMYVATCNNGINGAGCIFYPDFFEQTARRFGGSYYILPASIHEMILVPDDGDVDADHLAETVSEINGSEVDPEDKLTDSVYYYDATNKEFKRIR